MKWSLCILNMVLLLLVIVCLTPSIESKRRIPAKCPLKNPFESFKVLTYNAILNDNGWPSKGLPVPNNRMARRDALIEYLNNTDASVICLQEVYLGPDMQVIVDALSDKFPHAQSQLHLFNGVLPPQVAGFREPVCDAAAVFDLGVCQFLEGCFIGNGLESLAQCLLLNCLPEALKVFATGGSKCITCLLNGTPFNTDVCVDTDPVTDNWDINPMGLLLLSKQPMTNRLIVPHYQNVPMTLQRGYIQATINDEITLACSHQTSTDTLAFEPILSQFIPDNDLQNGYEIGDLVRRLGHEKALVLLGDMNVGGSCPGVFPLKQERYDLLTDTFNTDSVKECTYCANNPYNVLDSTNVNVTIDHIFTHGPLEVTNSMTVLKVDDASVSVGGVPYPLSDHYGVEATITCSCNKHP